VTKTLELFKVLVVDQTAKTKTPDISMIGQGLTLDFVPTASQRKVLESFFQPLDVRTLFTREERDNADPFALIAKQVLHYIEVYGLDTPGLFDLEVTTGQIITMNYVRGVTQAELGDMVRELVYQNAPVADVEGLVEIIKEYDVDLDINQVANNELRVTLFDVKKDVFTDGDDAVRYLVYATTDSTMLIKSPEVLAAIKDNRHLVTTDFFDRHVLPLAQVFNRHKRIIMQFKSALTRTVINRISRQSKTRHVPLRESVAKTFVSRALQGKFETDKEFEDALARTSIRDKFKYLNLLAYKRQQRSTDAFVIRNGKIHVKDNRKIWDITSIDRTERAVLAGLQRDLSHLQGQKLLLDENVAYGLPISRKQAVGQLPFGTQIDVKSDRISAGIYWHNDGGASDLDLSTVDESGNRTGWGMSSGYNRDNAITFSGDITSAPNGAMEFMTSAKKDYGLFVNIFSGNHNCEMEVVVGPDSDKSEWISDVVIREKTMLTSRQMIVGFVHDKKFTVWQGRLGSSRISGGNTAIVARGSGEFWTLNDVLEHLDIDFDVTPQKDVDYDHDLRYNAFTYDKLEALLK